MRSLSLLFICACSLNFNCVKRNTAKKINDEPLKKAFVENGVVAYVSYEVDSGRIEKIDTVVLDSRGNVVSIKNIGCCFRELEMRYDSLDRLISTSLKSDISNFVSLEYESPSENLLVCTEFLSDKEGGPSEMVYRTITEFEVESGNPINQTEIHLITHDTLKFNLKYEEGTLIKEALLPEKDSIYTKYEYSNGRLIRKRRVKNVDLNYITEEDFFSENTGLRDSTHTFDGEFSYKTYYKYHFRNR